MMTRDEAHRILFVNGYLGRYYGPGYNSKKARDNFMACYPRGKGIKANCKNTLLIYEACRMLKIDQSRSKSYRTKEDTDVAC